MDKVEKCGIMYIDNIINHQGQFLSLNELEVKYKLKLNVPNLYSLQKAIPEKWKQLLAVDSESDVIKSFKSDIWLMVNDSVMELCNISSNTIYWMYVTQKQAPLASMVKWEALYEMDSHVWMNIFKLSFQSVRETVIQSVQYRILSRVFPCNYWLHKLQIKSYNRCDQCGYIDSIEHFLVFCPVDKLFGKT